jgi:hypothetical protein
MDYFDIIKKSYQLTIKHKFLWLFGIIVSLATGIFRGFSYSFNATCISNYTGSEMLLLFTLFILLILAFIALAYTSQAGLIVGFSKLSSGSTTNFKDSFETGIHKIWRIIGLQILISIGIIVSLIILGVPVGLLVASHSYVIAIVLGIILFIACMFFWIILGFIYPYSLRMVVLEKKGVFTSIRESLHFCRDNFLNVFVMYLLAYAVSIGYGVALMIAAGLVGALLFIIGYGIWLASPLTAAIYGSLSFIIFVFALVLVGAIYTAFNSGLFTITYLRLKKQ